MGRKKFTTDDFVNKAKEIHGDKYDYSAVEYVNIYTPVTIICPDHGEFSQVPNDHLCGYGCRKCGMIKNWNNRGRITTEEWIKKARGVHGDKYDYSRVEYINNREKVEIICHKKYKNGEEHGSFFQKANSHLNGNGCPHCRSSSLERKVRRFLSESNIVFEEEKTFEWLRGKSHLYLDFYIPFYNIGIECQGIQHYMPLEINDRVTLDYIIENDKLKKRLCDENGVRVVYFTDKCIYDKYCENNGSNFFDLETMLNEIKNGS